MNAAPNRPIHVLDGAPNLDFFDQLEEIGLDENLELVGDVAPDPCRRLRRFLTGLTSRWWPTATICTRIDFLTTIASSGSMTAGGSTILAAPLFRPFAVPLVVLRLRFWLPPFPPPFFSGNHCCPPGVTYRVLEAGQVKQFSCAFGPG